jgi:hypothetical protein
VDFVSGANHAGGPQANDQGCTLCHSADGNAIGKSVSVAHDWMNVDPRNVPEYDVTMTVTGAANGEYFVAGESPTVHIVARDHATGTLLDHTTIRQEAGGAEGCTLPGPCPAGDGLFTAPLFVHGPRANRQPVLTTKARVEITSNGVGPFNLSAVAANATATFRFDQGVPVRYEDATGGDKVYAGVVSVPWSAAAFGNTSAATPAELAAWLNANAAFAARGIAYLEPDGRLSVRSRNLGKLFALQVDTGDIASTVFPAAQVNVVQVQGGFTLSNSLARQAAASANDPKVEWLAGEILYHLDPVTDLEAGTYIATIEFGDRGRVDAVNYRTPSVAKVTFNVKQAEEELPPAGNCGDCHQNNSGTGFVLDYARHYKIFDDTAVDQCGACHDYQPGAASDPAGANVWNGSKPISRRVHGIHFGSSLNYPLATVDYSNGDPIPGRNWSITYPQDVRNCETCHKDENTSGSWATNANRLACSGCHDSDAAAAHFRLQTFDPTPAAAWSGDEEESCTACH